MGISSASRNLCIYFLHSAASRQVERLFVFAGIKATLVHVACRAQTCWSGLVFGGCCDVGGVPSGLWVLPLLSGCIVLVRNEGGDQCLSLYIYISILMWVTVPQDILYRVVDHIIGVLASKYTCMYRS